ncbi:TRAF3-interacting protein 1 [Hetaerina americana]|uniref:TRAF3-interacting protein 1 n=1 Tax=Hetaerina americana TaxID=62018 RepID=UPI003A7F14D4
MKMGDEVKPTVIKKTQDTLGKFIKRPPLSEKLLRKPPFRFLHDVITTAIRETKFFDGLFTDEEMNSENVTDKESKMAFLQKVIDVVSKLSLAVRPAKIVAGYEPEKTNELLQIIGRAIEKKMDSSQAVQKVLAKGKGSKEAEQPTAKKSHPKKEEQGKTKKVVPQPPEKKQPRDKAGGDTSKQKKPTAAKGEEKEKKPTATNREESKKLHNATKDKKPKKSEDKQVAASKDAKHESQERAPKEREKKAGEEAGRVVASGKASERGRRGSSAAVASAEAAKETIVEAVGEGADMVVEEDVAMVRQPPTKKASLDAIDIAEVEDAFASLEPPISEQDNAQANAQETLRGHEGHGDGATMGDSNASRTGSQKRRQAMTAMPNEDLRSAASSVQRVAISTPVVRPASVMSMAASRPRSARPHAPRLRSALGGLIPAEEADSVVVPKGGGRVSSSSSSGGKGGPGEQEVAGLMADATVEDADAAEFLVEEARPPSPSAAIRQMESGGGEGGREGGVAGEQGREQQGLLVAKILETKKELESGVEEGEEGSRSSSRHGTGQAKRVEIDGGVIAHPNTGCCQEFITALHFFSCLHKRVGGHGAVKRPTKINVNVCESVAVDAFECEYGEEEARERRRRGLGEAENLQSMVQAIARAAHPLGSLLAILQENVDSMRSETGKWRAEGEQLLKQLKDEEKQMELELEPLRLVLSEVEQRVIEEREAVSAAKARVLKAERRIHVMLDPKGSPQGQVAQVS